VTPKEIRNTIASFLDIRSLVNFSMACKTFGSTPEKPKYIMLNSIETIRHRNKYFGTSVDMRVEYGGIGSDLENEFMLEKEVCNTGVINGWMYNVWSYAGRASVIAICPQKACRGTSIYVYAVPRPIYVIDLIDATFDFKTYLYGIYNDTNKELILKDRFMGRENYLITLFNSQDCKKLLKQLSPKM